MADTTGQQIADQIDKIAKFFRDGGLERLAKSSNIDINLPSKDDLEEYKKIATKYLEEGKLTVTTKANEVVDFTTKQLEDAGIIKREGQLTPSQEKAKEAYETTKNMVTEQVAVMLKKDGNILKLAALTGDLIKVPDNNDNAAYRKFANDLIEKREITVTLVDGKTKTITIADLDKALAETAKDPNGKELYNQITGALKANTFDAGIPDNHKRGVIAQSVGNAVEENTGNIKWLGGASIMNAIMGLIMWIIGGFDGGFDGLRKSIADETAKSIGHDTRTKLIGANTGLSAEVIGQISQGVQSETLKKAGYATDKNTPALPTLETTNLPAELSVAQPPAEKPPAEKPPAQKPPAEKPPAEKPPAQKPPAQKPPAEKPPAQKPPAEKPPAEKPPAEKPLAAGPRVSETKKLVDDIAAKMMAGATGANAMKPESIAAIKDVLMAELNKKEIQDLVKAGRKDELSAKLAEALLNNEKSYAAILEYTSKDQTQSEKVRAAAAKALEYKDSSIPGVSSAAKSAFVLLAKGELGKKITGLVNENGERLKNAIAQDQSVSTGHALNGAGVNDQETTRLADAARQRQGGTGRAGG